LSLAQKLGERGRYAKVSYCDLSGYRTQAEISAQSVFKKQVFIKHQIQAAELSKEWGPPLETARLLVQTREKGIS